MFDLPFLQESCMKGCATTVTPLVFSFLKTPNLKAWKYGFQEQEYFEFEITEKRFVLEQKKPLLPVPINNSDGGLTINWFSISTLPKVKQTKNLSIDKYRDKSQLFYRYWLKMISYTYSYVLLILE